MTSHLARARMNPTRAQLHVWPRHARVHVMFAPDPYRCDDPHRLWPLIEAIRLGSVACCDAKGAIVVSHVPIVLDRTRGPLGTLIGHFDRRNPHCAALAQADEAVVSFLGPDSGVSPDWYGTAPRVPTWLYVAVQARGRATMVTDVAGLRDSVVRASVLALAEGSPWSADGVEDYMAKLLPHIVGFEIPLHRLEGQLRLAQQNGPDDRARVERALSAGSLQQRRMAEAMRRFADDLPVMA
ncbi:FMN-binding negative transcriptional regulator [Tanticharoenia sakaeratensis]|uniref:Transcriptional repressor of sporulation and degradative enzyme production n=1 Tax=Tanticharoenia sakaeratensis NBRC 103193 TaxID=1231623 RepID=A0A0D6MMX1_9PROT|nr:FMN-binding negative transcriptional regulator [Tanticharoenia sakaeratensis]GAN54781.1 transcriptional repressor of sporulation and degradative enzyme production [Tanticharoenia sakaeratensis NBRC 103193]GBQ25403.1 transcriptional regulator [Tanticharoenia sakaeratensis NBRC 103193]